MKTKILVALFISALCTSKVLANNNMFTGYNNGMVGLQSPSIQPVYTNPTCTYGGIGSGFGTGTAITEPNIGGGSTTFYNANGYSGTAITVPNIGGGSTTFY